jgi:hypothetical protein
MKKNLITFILLLTMFSMANFSFAGDPGVPDTCWVERLDTVLASSQIVVNVYVFNDSNIGGFTIPLAFPDSVTNLDITCDSISFVGTRGASSTYRSDAIFCAECIDNAKNRLDIFAVWFVGAMTPGGVGDGPVAKIYFTTGPTWDSSLSVPVDSTFWPPVSKLEFADEGGNPYVPVFMKGALEVREVNTPTRPTVFSLSQNYPNPFNPKTIIRFGLPKDSWVKLEIYNVLGQKVKTLVDEKLTTGLKEVEWDGVNDKGFEVASGIYFYKISADDYSDIKKMVMLK